MKYQDRDLSWLSFNERILQEAENPETPLMERLKFLAIYSSNLAEFYKVRVAGHRFEQRYRGDKKNKFGYRPSFILQQINHIVNEQQARLGGIFYQQIVPSLAKEGIHLLKDDLTSQDLAAIKSYYQEHLAGQFELTDITDEKELELKNQAVYLYLLDQNRSYLLALDYDRFGRFISLLETEKEQRIIQLDDIFKINVGEYLSPNAEVYAIKISRDAELYIDEEQDENIVKKIQKSIRKRDSGMPARLLFDEYICFRYINDLRIKMDIDMSSLIPGGRYHNFFDFFGFPVSKERKHLFNTPDVPVPCSLLDQSEDWFQTLKETDVFLSFPYQRYHYVTRFLQKAAADEAVEAINITLYRVAKESAICQALEQAALNGKQIFVLAEVQARFDEESNIYWGERLAKAGATVIYGVPKLKVHAKIFSVKRKEEGVLLTYSYLGTGNFNEKTAGSYADHALLTTNPIYTEELDQVFHFLKNNNYQAHFKHLLVAPFNLRKELNRMIDREIELAKSGETALMKIKLNSLEDLDMIDRIREAADAGVKIEMVIRGICCYTPLSPQQKQNIKIVSILDRYLEHTRIYHFHNNGDAATYLASADWMNRNLSKRVEVAFPIIDDQIRRFLLQQIDIQLNDQKKGRLVACEEENTFVKGKNTSPSQSQMFELVRQLNTTPTSTQF